MSTTSQILDSAVQGERPAITAVTQALLESEQQTRHDRQQFAEAHLMGDWRLCFSTMGKVKLGDQRLRGFYLPGWLPAQIGFAATEHGDTPITITNQITVGLVTLKLSGPAKYSDKKNLLAFDFTQIEVCILGKSIYNGSFPSPRSGKEFMAIPIGKLPFFAFFAVTDRYIAARGRGGGLAIWVK
ncbi:MAG: hypothetical protein RLZZ511_1373 [Cyanobacteriota bacterium]|jgi:hypothetical protein